MVYFKLNIKTFLLAALFIAIFVLAPHQTFAANVYLSSDYQSISVGDTIIVNVSMDPMDKTPNVVEGNIMVTDGTGNVKMLELSTAGSVLNYWAQGPSIDSDSKVSFIGGKPNGFDKTSLLFKIILSAQSAGRVTFSPANIIAYNNDAKSSPVAVTTNALTIDIGPKGSSQPKNQWLETVSKDNKPPQQLSANVGQDESIVGGKKFITIFAVDNESGLSHYDVKEGNWPATSIPVGEIYILRDQQELSVVTITAYDKAGNYSTFSLTPAKSKINYWTWVVVLIVCVVLIYILFRFLKVIKKKQKNG
jgi:hypothetical protein